MLPLLAAVQPGCAGWHGHRPLDAGSAALSRPALGGDAFRGTGKGYQFPAEGPVHTPAPRCAGSGGQREREPPRIHTNHFPKFHFPNFSNFSEGGFQPSGAFLIIFSLFLSMLAISSASRALTSQQRPSLWLCPTTLSHLPSTASTASSRKGNGPLSPAFTTKPTSAHKLTEGFMNASLCLSWLLLL